MQLNPGSSAGLLDDVNFICGTDTVSYPTADKVRNINNHYYKTLIDIRKVVKGAWGDPNLASLPKVDLTMVDNTHEVALTTVMNINYVEIKDISGFYVRLKFMDFEEFQRTFSSASTTKGFPTTYTLVGNYIYLNTAPDSTLVTVSSGLRVWGDPELDVFLTSDTTQEPGIAEPFHRILSIGCSLDWLAVNDTDEKYQKWFARYEQARQELRDWYKAFVRDIRTSIKPAHTVRDYE